MEALLRELASVLISKGISKQDGELAMQCLETEEQFRKLLEEVRDLEDLNRYTLLSIAVLIAENEL